MQASPTKRKRVRRDRRRPITRQRIVDATRELVVEGGSGSLTKAAICARAEIDRSIIYDHFPDVDSCVRAAAEQLADEMVERDGNLRHATEAAEHHGLARALHLSRSYLQAAVDTRQVSRMMLRCRHEDSALGQAVRDGFDRGNAQLAEDLWLETVGLVADTTGQDPCDGRGAPGWQ